MTEEEKFKTMVQDVLQDIFKQGFPVCAIEGYKLAELQKKVEKNENALEGKDGVIIKVDRLTVAMADMQDEMKEVKNSVKVSQSDIRETLNMLRQQQIQRAQKEKEIAEAPQELSDTQKIFFGALIAGVLSPILVWLMTEIFPRIFTIPHP